MKNKISKIIWGINVVVILFLVFNLGIILVSPLDEIETFERNIEFRWTGWNREYEFFLDNNRDFASPEVRIIRGTRILVEDLDIGDYWWKVRSRNVESKAQKFSVISKVGLDILEEENGLLLRNSGNVEEKISSITGRVIADMPYNSEILIEKIGGEIVARTNE